MGCGTSSTVKATSSYPRQQFQPYPVQQGGPVYNRPGYDPRTGYIGAPATSGASDHTQMDAFIMGAAVGYGAHHMMMGPTYEGGLVEGPMGVDIV